MDSRRLNYFWPLILGCIRVRYTVGIYTTVKLNVDVVQCGGRRGLLLLLLPLSPHTASANTCWDVYFFLWLLKRNTMTAYILLLIVGEWLQ